ncbi:MAG: trypsin-like peptidase domain-containing protein [candidate division WOR-3 bacterium]|nr:MAG: trypsin-like peptidase domain-containing protein [candidate division WOR-3 bacterium]
MKLLPKDMFRFVYCMLFAVVIIPSLGHGDEIAELSKTIMEQGQEAVVLTKTVLEMFDSERKVEGLASVINKEGLAVISLTSIDPASFYRSGFGEVKVKDIKMILSDNTEIPSKVVLRDPELDLAFIKPIEKIDRDLNFVSLFEHTIPQMLDHIVVLSRLGSALSNVPSISIARVQAIIEKPRTMYVPDPFIVLASGMGTPVFALDGNIIGILLMRVTRGNESYQSDVGGLSGLGMLPIILPAQEIIDVMEKAPELKE